MRWFKHMVGSGQDEKLILLKDEYGMEGYGVYWTILEHIAAQINSQNQQTFLELSPKSWRKVTDFSPKKFQKYATFCSEISLFSVTFTSEKIKIDCPKILKYKDEYSRKSGHTPDLPPVPKSGATPEEDKETDKDKDLLGGNGKSPRKFIPPTVEDVRAYITEKNISIDPQKFVDHYETTGWMRGKNKIKDWKACVRTWKTNGAEQHSPFNEPGSI